MNLPAVTSIRIGARGSNLSLRQVGEVVAAIVQRTDGATCEVVPISTLGDRNLDSPLPELGGKGAFTDEISRALLDGQIDLAVHSLKDLPVQQPDGIVIGAVLPRAMYADVMISRDGVHLGELKQGAVVGSSSLRRAAQIKRVRPDLVTQSIRGNVETRLRKLDEPDGPFDAIVLAAAGLLRLDLGGRITEVLRDEVMLPAPGQGAIAVQCREAMADSDVLHAIDHRATNLAVTAERAFLHGLGGGCSAPVAALGSVEGDLLHLHGRVLSLDGVDVVDIEVMGRCQDLADAIDLGRGLAEQALANGADRILQAVAG